MRKQKKDMSGKLLGIVTPDFDATDFSIIECEFDKITNLEEKDIKNGYEAQTILKRYLMVKLALFPLHWILLRIFVGRNDAKYLLNLHKEFVKIIRMEHVPPELIIKFSDYTV